jgi:hypothetical protein
MDTKIPLAQFAAIFLSALLITAARASPLTQHDSDAKVCRGAAVRSLDPKSLNSPASPAPVANSCPAPATAQKSSRKCLVGDFSGLPADLRNASREPLDGGRIPAKYFLLIGENPS